MHQLLLAVFYRTYSWTLPVISSNFELRTSAAAFALALVFDAVRGARRRSYVGMRTHAASQPAAARPIIPLLPYQREDIEANDRFRWNCWSRQTGKSFTKSLRRILRGLQRRRNQIFLSAGERQSIELMQKARQHCQALQIAADYRDDRTFRGLSVKQLEIQLPGGVRIIGLPANPLTARGYTGDVLLDEFAMHADDREIWASIFPTVLRGDGELDVASTPKGRSNMFHDLRDNLRFVPSTVTLHDAIAQGLDADAEEMRAAIGDEELFRQEFLCEFLDESTAFLTYEQIAACADPTLSVATSVSELDGRLQSAARTKMDFDNASMSAPLTKGGHGGFSSGGSIELFAGVDVGRVRDLTVFWVFARGTSLSHEATKRNQHRRFPSRGRKPMDKRTLFRKLRTSLPPLPGGDRGGFSCQTVARLRPWP